MPTGLQVTRAGQLAQDLGAKIGAIGWPMAPQMSQNGTRNPSPNPTIVIVVFWRGQMVPMRRPKRPRNHQNNHNMRQDECHQAPRDPQNHHNIMKKITRCMPPDPPENAWAPDGSQWLQMAPGGSRGLQMAPESSRWLQMPPDGSRWLQVAPDGSR